MFVLFLFSKYFGERRFSVIVSLDTFIFIPVSRANVGCSSTGLEADRQCDVWVHVSSFLWQNALCGGETSKNSHGNSIISAARVKQNMRV